MQIPLPAAEHQWLEGAAARGFGKDYMRFAVRRFFETADETLHNVVKLKASA